LERRRLRVRRRGRGIARRGGGRCAFLAFKEWREVNEDAAVRLPVHGATSEVRVGGELLEEEGERVGLDPDLWVLGAGAVDHAPDGREAVQHGKGTVTRLDPVARRNVERDGRILE